MCVFGVGPVGFDRASNGGALASTGSEEMWFELAEGSSEGGGETESGRLGAVSVY